MPINYKTSFTKPLQLTIERKGVGGPDALAREFTNQYVRALLQGLPGGTPTKFPLTLPAPGLNPTAPPPYPIAATAVPINNFEARKRRMQNVLKVYFTARQLIVQNNSIKAIINNIKYGIELIPKIKKDIQILKDEAKAIVEEVQRLPALVEELKVVVVELYKEEIKNIEVLLESLKEFKLQLSVEETRAFSVINSFRNQNITIDTLISALDSITVGIDNLENVITNIPTETENESNSEQNQYAKIKRYILNQILESFSNIFYLTSSVVSPLSYIGHFRDLAAFDPKYRRVVLVLQEYRYLYLILKPQIKKLEVKIETKLRELKSTVTTKVLEQKKLLAEKQKERAAKKDNASKVEQKKKRVKFIKDFKKEKLPKIRKTKKIIKETSTILKLVKSITERTKRLKSSVEYQLKDGLFEFIDGINNTNITTTVQAGIGVSGNAYSIGIGLTQSTNQALSYDVYPATNVSLSQQDVENINSTIGRSGFFNNLDLIFDKIGLPKSTVLRTLIKQSVKEVKFDSPYPIYRYFLEEGAQYIQIYNEVTQLRKEIKEAYIRLKFLKKNIKNPPDKYIDTNTEEFKSLYEINTLVSVSLKDCLNELYSSLEEDIKKFRSDFDATWREYKNTLAEEGRKFNEFLEYQIYALVPIDSEKKEGLDKKELLKYKKKRVKDRINQTKSLVKGTRILFKAFNAVRKLIIKNLIVDKKYSYRDNAKEIDDAIDSFFEYKIFELGYPNKQWYNDPEELRNQGVDQRDAGYVAAQTRLLQEQRDTLKTDIRALLTYLELFVDLIVEVVETLKNNNQELIHITLKKRLVEKFESSPDIQQYVQFPDLLQRLVADLYESIKKGPKSIYDVYTTMLRFDNFVKEADRGTRIFTKSNFKTALIQVENLYFGNIKRKYDNFYNSELKYEMDRQLILDPVIVDEGGRISNETSKRSKYYATLQKFVPQKPFEESILYKVVDAFVYIIREIGKFIEDLYIKYIQPTLSKQIEGFKKQYADINESLDKFSKRLIDYDTAFALPRVLNLATKLFWTNFTWLSGDGTKFKCIQVPPIAPLRDPITNKIIIPDDGFTGWINAAGWALFEYQLPAMVGLLQPPPNTGIPPIPFVGYK